MLTGVGDDRVGQAAVFDQEVIGQAEPAGGRVDPGAAIAKAIEVFMDGGRRARPGAGPAVGSSRRDRGCVASIRTKGAGDGSSKIISYPTWISIRPPAKRLSLAGDVMVWLR